VTKRAATKGSGQKIASFLGFFLIAYFPIDPTNSA
jgi:hypothetical protein